MDTDWGIIHHRMSNAGMLYSHCMKCNLSNEWTYYHNNVLMYFDHYDYSWNWILVTCLVTKEITTTWSDPYSCLYQSKSRMSTSKFLTNGFMVYGYVFCKHYTYLSSQNFQHHLRTKNSHIDFNLCKKCLVNFKSGDTARFDMQKPSGFEVTATEGREEVFQLSIFRDR